MTTTTNGHRFGYQSGLFESPGQNSAAILNFFAFHVYFVFSDMNVYSKYQGAYTFLSKTDTLGTRCLLVHKNKHRLRQACSAANRVAGYQYIYTYIPVYIYSKMQIMSNNNYYTLSVLAGSITLPFLLFPLGHLKCHSSVGQCCVIKSRPH